MTHDRLLLAWAGWLALLGAGLRFVMIFPNGLNPGPLAEPTYFVIDVLLTLGLTGLFAGAPAFRTRAGAAGFAIAITGILCVRTGQRLLGPQGYAIGAAMIAVGLALAGLGLVRSKGLARFAGGVWITSLAVGLAGATTGRPSLSALAVGLFCLGLALGGLGQVRGARMR